MNDEWDGEKTSRFYRAFLIKREIESTKKQRFNEMKRLSSLNGNYHGYMLQLKVYCSAISTPSSHRLVGGLTKQNISLLDQS